MKIRNIALLGATAWSLTACATVINGTSQDYQILSDPDGATASLSGGQSCVTPCEVVLKRRHDLRVDFELDGYEPTYVLVQSRLGGSVAGNLLLGGIVGGVVDGANGASNHLYPRPLHVQLVPEGESGEVVLLDEDGEVITTVAEHNAEVEEDVLEGIANQNDDSDSDD